MAHADHERAGRALGAPAQRRARRRRRRVVVGGPPRGGRPHRGAAPARRRLRRRGAARRAQRPHRGARVRRRRLVGARRRAVVRRLGDAAAPPARARAARRSRSRPSPRCHGACATPTATCTPTAPRCSASRRSTTPTAARPPTRSCGSPPTSRARPRSSWRAPTSCRTRGGRPDGVGVLLARVGPPRHAVGRHPARRRRRRRRARSSRGATSGSRSASRRGRPTARSGSSATARGSGACTGGRRTAGARSWSTSARTSASPQWVFGQSTYAFLDDGRVVFAYSRRRARAARGARAGLRSGHAPSTSRTPRSTALRAHGSTAPCASRPAPTTEPHVVEIDVDAGAVDVLVPPRDLGPRPTGGSRSPSRSRSRPPAATTAHALLYPPANPDVVGARRRAPAAAGDDPRRPDGRGPPDAPAVPPLLDEPRLRGGRRQLPRLHRLRPRVPRPAAGASGASPTWRTARRCARYLVERGDADPDRLCIRGGSAGGFTTLAALTFHEVFAAGASHYGVADLGGAGRRDPQVREPLPRRARRARGPRRGPPTRSARRSSTPIASTARWRCSRASTTRSCRPTRPR